MNPIQVLFKKIPAIRDASSYKLLIYTIYLLMVSQVRSLDIYNYYFYSLRLKLLLTLEMK